MSHCSNSPARRGEPFAAAVSGVLVSAAAIGIYVWVQPGGPSTPTAGETVSASNAADGVSGTVQYWPTGWGSRVQITLEGVKPGEDRVLHAMDQNGHEVIASSWRAPQSPGGSATVPGGVAMQSSDIVTFQVSTALGQVLLTIPAS